MKTPKSLQKLGRALGFDTDLDNTPADSDKTAEKSTAVSETEEKNTTAYEKIVKNTRQAKPVPKDKAPEAEHKDTPKKDIEPDKEPDIESDKAKKAQSKSFAEKLPDVKPLLDKTLTQTGKVKDYVFENITVFIGGIVCILIVLIVAVVAAINWSGMKTRVVRIAEISGSVSINNGTYSISANTNDKLSPFDTLILEEDARVRLKIDPDIYLTVEENTALYLDYTNIEGTGDIYVNLQYGSVIAEMKNEIGAKDTFSVVTPNAAINAKDAVFRTAFEYKDESQAKITDINNFTGNLTLILFDDNGERFDSPMISTPKTTARLITSPSLTDFISLNADMDLEALSKPTLAEILRISNSFKTLDYSTIELNDALKVAAMRDYTTTTISLPETVSITPFEPIIPPPVTTTTTQTAEELEVPTETGTPAQTIPTTRTVGEMTTYTGEKWWEIPNTGE